MGDILKAQTEAWGAKATQPQLEEIQRFAEQIRRLNDGELDPDDFKKFRLENGIYGIRGTTDEHMIRVKLKYGVLDAAQMDVLATLDRLAGDGTQFYVDPPYPSQGASTGDFTAYTATGFSLIQHREMRDACEAATLRGARVICSMGDCFFARKIWRDWKIDEVQMRRSVNSNGGGRGAVTELLITRR